MTGKSELRIYRRANVNDARAIRQALRAFLNALDIEQSRCDDVITAVGETLVNAIEHGYNGSGGEVELFARLEAQGLLVDVYDRGSFIERSARPDRGLGLKIVRAIARAVSIDTSDGTAISMQF